MGVNLKIFIMLLVVYAISTPVFAKWDQQCLNDCFDTGHECKYCDWQCTVSDEPPPKWVYSDSPCALNYKNGNDY